MFGPHLCQLKHASAAMSVAIIPEMLDFVGRVRTTPRRRTRAPLNQVTPLSRSLGIC